MLTWKKLKFDEQSLYNKRSKFAKTKYKNTIKNMQQPIQILYGQLEKSVQQDQHHNLILNSKCECAVCAHSPQTARVHADLYQSSSPEAYLNMFTLLQHLTLIQIQTAPRILGELFIPMLFFKRGNKNLEHIKKNYHTIANKSQSFLMFCNNPVNGCLQSPTLVNSISKASKIMKSQFQFIRKNKSNFSKYKLQQNKQIKDMQKGYSKNFIHSKLFNEIVPSYRLSFPNSQNSTKSSQFIIHKDERFISDEQQGHKLRQSQPFCVFRYIGSKQEAKVSKYQIFTMETLQLHEKGKTLDSIMNNKSKQDLVITCIESYIRIKTKPKSQKLPKINQNSQNQELQFIHFSQYNKNKRESYKHSQIWNLTELQVNLRYGKINKIDSKYLNSIDLQLKIESIVKNREQLSNQKMRRIIQYKTYKTVNVLQIVCGIKIEFMQLKWMLDEDDNIILTQCLQYKADVSSYLANNKKNQQHAYHILNSGLQYLEEGYNMEDSHISKDDNKNIDDLISYHSQHTKQLKQLQLANSQMQGKSNKSKLSQNDKMQRVSKSMEIRTTKKKINNIGANNRSLQNGMVNSMSQAESMGVDRQLLCLPTRQQIMVRYSKLRKSYKLRAFKTQSSTQC